MYRCYISHQIRYSSRGGADFAVQVQGDVIVRKHHVYGVPVDVSRNAGVASPHPPTTLREVLIVRRRSQRRLFGAHPEWVCPRQNIWQAVDEDTYTYAWENCAGAAFGGRCVRPHEQQHG